MKRNKFLTVILLVLICFTIAACSATDYARDDFSYDEPFEVGSTVLAKNNSFEVKEIANEDESTVSETEEPIFGEEDSSAVSSSFPDEQQEDIVTEQEVSENSSLASEEENVSSTDVPDEVEEQEDVPAEIEKQENVSEEKNEEQELPEESEIVEEEEVDPLDDVDIVSLWDSRNFLKIFQVLMGNEKAETAFKCLANIYEDEFGGVYDFVKTYMLDDEELFEELMNRVSADDEGKEGYYIFKVEQNELGDWEVVNESVFKTNTNYLITIVSCVVVSLVLFVFAVWFTSKLIIKKQMKK